jgi:hypothetical protein
MWPWKWWVSCLPFPLARMKLHFLIPSCGSEWPPYCHLPVKASHLLTQHNIILRNAIPCSICSSRFEFQIMKNNCNIFLVSCLIYKNISYCFYLIYDKSSYPQSLPFQCVDYNVLSEIPVPVIVLSCNGRKISMNGDSDIISVISEVKFKKCMLFWIVLSCGI